MRVCFMSKSVSFSCMLSLPVLPVRRLRRFAAARDCLRRTVVPEKCDYVPIGSI